MTMNSSELAEADAQVHVRVNGEMVPLAQVPGTRTAPADDPDTDGQPIEWLAMVKGCLANPDDTHLCNSLNALECTAPTRELAELLTAMQGYVARRQTADGIPTLDLRAPDRAAEHARYSAAVRAWAATR